MFFGLLPSNFIDNNVRRKMCKIGCPPVSLNLAMDDGKALGRAEVNMSLNVLAFRASYSSDPFGQGITSELKK